jgi:hypothetical protein
MAVGVRSGRAGRNDGSDGDLGVPAGQPGFGVLD